MKRYNILIYSSLSVFLLLFVWLLVNYGFWFRSGIFYKLRGIGAIFGILGYCLLSTALFLSSRIKSFKAIFLRLDEVYNQHRFIGIAAFGCIIIHPLFLGIKWLPNHLKQFFFFYLPLHGRVSVNLGILGFWLLFILVGITFLKVFSYDKWKISHKAMSFVFILVSLHIFLSSHLFGYDFFSKVILILPLIVGLFSIIYKQVIYEYFTKKSLYELVQVKKLNCNTIEICMRAEDNPMTFTAGQYAFFSFLDSSFSKESHPFTLCFDVNNSLCSIIVKARGDFTQALFERAKPGQFACVEGPYGAFDYKIKKSDQIWIAGGIGVVPFLAWVRQDAFISDKKRLIDLFYCVHEEKDLIGLEEFEEFKRKNDSFNFYIFCSEKNNRLNVEKLQKCAKNFYQSSFLLCGPKRMTKEFSKELSKKNIKKKDIFFEEFEFF